MTALGSYYYLSSLIFLLDVICDFIFYSTYKKCPLDNSAAGIFLFLVILNIILIVFMLLVGLLVNYFEELDPDEFDDLGWFKKFLGFLCTNIPTLCKIVHYVKVLMVFIGIYFAFINNEIGTSYLGDLNLNLTAMDKDCSPNTTLYLNTTRKNYKGQVMLFQVIEMFSVSVTLCVCGLVKNLIDISGYFNVPQNPQHSKLRVFLFRRLGP
jgi:hypothetical protein